MLHTHLSSGVGSTGQLVADVRSGLSLTTPQEAKKTTIKMRLMIKLGKEGEPIPVTGRGGP
jgi:hypothetical protein